MKKEISKGTQKFIWHLVAFVAVFVLALVILCRVLPEPSRTADVNQNTQVTSSQTNENLSTDFDSVKERVDKANSTTGKEIKNLYTGDGKSTMEKQLETRLFFNTLKSILICVLLVVVIVVLLKKGFSLKKVKKLIDDDDDKEEEPEEETDNPAEDTEPTDDTEPSDGEQDDSDVPSEEPETAEDNSDASESNEDEEPPIVDPTEPDEQEVAENCKL